MNINTRNTNHRSTARSEPRRGFTLVEVLIATILLGLVLGLLLYWPLKSSFSYFRSASARADAQSAARIALDAVARELTEAMYVQLDMYDNSMIAFMLPLREDPNDPNSELVMPPRPDPSRAIRYWRALHDPTLNYNPSARLGTSNTYFLARTAVPYPAITDDPWNRWNDDWAASQNASAANGKTNWSPISRAVHTDVDTYEEMRTTTLQPGFPYLWMQHLLNDMGVGEAEATRAYRDYVVALTPNALDYDVSRLEFTPMAVSGEWLQPIRSSARSDRSVYRSQYPLWRFGTPSSGWTALSEGLALPFPSWARDPFLIIDGYRYDDATASLTEKVAIGIFDPDSRSMKVFDAQELRDADDPDTVQPIYDSLDYYSYPNRNPVTQWMAFGVDWVQGAVRFDFPPPEDPFLGELYFLDNAALQLALSFEGDDKWDLPLPLWTGRDSAGEALQAFLVPDSIQVWTNSAPEVTTPDLLLTPVSSTPWENNYYYQLGAYPEVGPSSPGDASAAPNYGWIRLPSAFGEGDATDTHSFWVTFRWHDNGVWFDGSYYWDLISAYYRTASILDISLTVARADPGGPPERRIAQSADMTRRVKLHNLVRTVRYAED